MGVGSAVGVALEVGDGLAVGVELACWGTVALGSGLFVGGSAVGETGRMVGAGTDEGASAAGLAQPASAYPSARKNKQCGRRVFMAAFYHTGADERGYAS
jgi:hypothetical protein